MAAVPKPLSGRVEGWSMHLRIGAQGRVEVNLILLLLLVWLYILQVTAQAPAGCVEMSIGRVCYGGNEVSVLSTVEDPAGLRLGAPAGESLGHITFNRVVNNKHDLVCMIVGREDDRYPVGTLAGEIG